MGLEKRLKGLHPFESDSVVEGELKGLVKEYGVDPKLVGDYLTYKYAQIRQEKTPVAIFFWYVDIYKKVNK